MLGFQVFNPFNACTNGMHIFNACIHGVKHYSCVHGWPQPHGKRAGDLVNMCYITLANFVQMHALHCMVH